MRQRKSEEREIEAKGKGGEQGRCRTDCNSIVLETAGHKQTLTCSSTPLALSFTLYPPYQPSFLASTPTLYTLPQILLYSIRAEIYTAQCVLLSFLHTHTHTHTHTQTAVTTAVGPPVSGPHEIAWCFLSLFSRDRFDKTTLILLHHGDVQCYDNTLP